MGRTTQRIKISLTKPLKALLNQRARHDRLEQRVEQLEKRLEQLERKQIGTDPVASMDHDAIDHNGIDHNGIDHDGIDPGIFWTDADEPPALNPQQRSSYEAWQTHYSLHPDEIEPGRTAHEMAALQAATRKPIERRAIDQEP